MHLGPKNIVIVHFSMRRKIQSMVDKIPWSTCVITLHISSPWPRKLFPFYLNYDKPCGELALGENCIKIISQDKSNSLGMFLEILKQ